MIEPPLDLTIFPTSENLSTDTNHSESLHNNSVSISGSKKCSISTPVEQRKSMRLEQLALSDSFLGPQMSPITNIQPIEQLPTCQKSNINLHVKKCYLNGQTNLIFR